MEFNMNMSEVRSLVTLIGQLFIIGYLSMMLTNFVFWLIEGFRAD